MDPNYWYEDTIGEYLIQDHPTMSEGMKLVLLMGTDQLNYFLSSFYKLNDEEKNEEKSKIRDVKEEYEKAQNSSPMLQLEGPLKGVIPLDDETLLSEEEKENDGIEEDSKTIKITLPQTQLVKEQLESPKSEPKNDPQIGYNPNNAKKIKQYILSRSNKNLRDVLKVHFDLFLEWLWKSLTDAMATFQLSSQASNTKGELLSCIDDLIDILRYYVIFTTEKEKTFYLKKIYHSFVKYNMLQRVMLSLHGDLLKPMCCLLKTMVQNERNQRVKVPGRKSKTMIQTSYVWVLDKSFLYSELMEQQFLPELMKTLGDPKQDDFYVEHVTELIQDILMDTIACHAQEPNNLFVSTFLKSLIDDPITLLDTTNSFSASEILSLKQALMDDNKNASASSSFLDCLIDALCDNQFSYTRKTYLMSLLEFLTNLDSAIPDCQTQSIGTLHQFVLTRLQKRVSDLAKLVIASNEQMTPSITYSAYTCKRQFTSYRMSLCRIWVMMLHYLYHASLMDSMMYENDMFGIFISWFFEFSQNNLAHGQIMYILQISLIMQSDTLNKKLFVDYSLLDTMLDVYNSKDPMISQKPYLLQLFNVLRFVHLANSKTSHFIASYLNDHKEWNAFQNTLIKDTLSFYGLEHESELSLGSDFMLYDLGLENEYFNLNDESNNSSFLSFTSLTSPTSPRHLNKTPLSAEKKVALMIQDLEPIEKINLGEDEDMPPFIKPISDCEEDIQPIISEEDDNNFIEMQEESPVIVVEDTSKPLVL
mmetsp:Transcript_2992/g.4377  ORF Transcript_2992/g.4377 Transcript_2992/m.4377 type:complete len:759 (-) Transcript_2992:1098-3374(-)